MVDYSKWDKMDVSDSEDEKPEPEVQSFDRPQTVTLGPEGASFSPQEGAPGRTATERTASSASGSKRSRGAGAPSGGDSAAMEVEAERRAPQPIDAAEAGKAAANGGAVGERYVWSQSPEEVQVHVLVPEGTLAKEVTVEVSEHRLSVRRQGCDGPLLAGDWEFPIAPEEDLDWEVAGLAGRRAVRVAVRKKPAPMDGMRVWWPCLLKGEPRIDVSKIDGRLNKDPNAFGKAWEEAHARFKERVKDRKPVEIAC
mmetsp:Transcript_57811/g.163139  ORF Transcript_57811/g.163139 Transcript_57811/m.163139 type:complete len:254 (+) Transcript_57811:77-838(+)